jgi:hypothetical protein
MIAPILPDGVSCPGSPPIPQLFVAAVQRGGRGTSLGWHRAGNCAVEVPGERHHGWCYHQGTLAVPCRMGLVGTQPLPLPGTSTMQMQHPPDEWIPGYGPLESSVFRTSGMVIVVVIMVGVSLVSCTWLRRHVFSCIPESLEQLRDSPALRAPNASFWYMDNGRSERRVLR